MPQDIDALIRSVNRKYKENVLVSGNDLSQRTYPRVTTGSLPFDVMLGGGWPLNCWNEIIGTESSGKTTMALKTIAANQALNPEYHTLWVAAEDLDLNWAGALGVNVDRCTFVMTNVMENAYDIILTVLEEQATDAVVIDSFPALVPTDEDDKNMTEYTVGRGALLTNKFMRKSLSAQRRSFVEQERDCLGLFINQWRDRIGVIGRADPRTTPGGKGKNYSFLTRVEVAREEWVFGTNRVKVGQTIKCRTVKNKTAPPQRTASIDFYFQDARDFSQGDYDITKAVVNMAITFDVIEQNGGWYNFGDKKWQGEKAVVAAIDADSALRDEVIAHIRHSLLKEPLPAKPTARRRMPRVSK
jgi:recombination protein RecA